MDISQILQNYDTSQITIAALGGHSALDVCEGAKKLGFRTCVVAQKGREKTYTQYYKSRKSPTGEELGCIDEIILVDKFADIVTPEVQEQLRALNAVMVHNRYFWVYCDFKEIETNFHVPIFGTRKMVRLEERDVEHNQYWMLEQAGIRTPKIIRPGDIEMSPEEVTAALDKHFVEEKGAPLIVKVNEAHRSYERAFFVCTSLEDYRKKSEEMIESGKILREDLHRATVEEFIIGAQVNFNYFYSPLSGELEIMGTDTRRQTSMDGFLRLDADTQMQLLSSGYKPSMVETGHCAVTTKESIIEKIFKIGEQFVETTKQHVKADTPGAADGMIGPFALQGAVAAREGREELVIFDVSMRIPGSPGTRFTPHTGYLHGRSVSYGERVAMEIRDAIAADRLAEVLT